MSLRLDPLYEKMLPVMSQEEFEQLRESIRTEGQHYPIIVSEDLVVLDGHHRFRACLELGVDPDFEVKHFENKLLEKKFVIEANLRRRHLNNFQLVELAVPLLEIEKALLKEKQIQKSQNESALVVETNKEDSFSELEAKGKTVENIARKAGVSTRTLERGKKIIEKASEDDKQKLREGKTSISKVYRDITPPKASQKIEPNPEKLIDSLKALHNKKALAEILQSIMDKDLFCPECGNKLFQCSQCHKSLGELVEDQRSLKTTVKSQQQAIDTKSDEQLKENKEKKEEEENSLEDNEDFKDEFF
ncbi:MAG: ParB N-terminal domain-containing protein [Candidatus Bathyarchaeota archaeon]|uniref:ParB N-terminal domain-containing protein n=1 Tax=Candidatus Bathycorpusculum sp. TaxID=2994959 RepID=UPI0028218188|nr:ParB N-terminal domain-containing protein [Candidatus Termiticorpusculum sp.]